jgi:hypothetical protein
MLDLQEVCIVCRVLPEDPSSSTLCTWVTVCLETRAPRNVCEVSDDLG